MANKMLIDASHPEETRVVVLRGNRVEEFDFESANKKQLRGNIYLAKVTRVEPSLQAAFVDYGGNRHGFLAFSEIHPDYYQIPVSDRQALIDEDARAQRDEDEDDSRGLRRSRRFRRGDRNGRRAEKRRGEDETLSESYEGEAPAEARNAFEAEAGPDASEGVTEAAHASEGVEPTQDAAQASELRREDAAAEQPAGEEPSDFAPEPAAASVEPSAPTELSGGVSPASADQPIEPSEAVRELAAVEADRPEEKENLAGAAESRTPEQGGEAEDESEEEEEEQIEQLGGDAMEELPSRPQRYRKQYKIQEVIKRRQVLLVQVVKEERGNKGAALTTYLSLAGRYSVLMPNTARGGGISRKITDSADRQRLKSIAQELEVPEGMGVIVRTAGASRSKAEVKRDFEYLLRMWETVRETTLQSTAPTLVYEEGSLIKRAIRDLYNKDIDEITVSGDNAYREAKEFMRLLMPSHAKNVQPYRDPQPLFAKCAVETQLDAMFSNQVTLKSGGYIVINQTEALVAIDVNSGRSTREHNIEDTALRTNLEAADEIARQLRLRDLAGLIVLDLIDMEENRNNRAVERRLKEALKNDRARIQVGRISHFGLLEMSRQRIRAGVLEGSTVLCPHCAGAGTVRSTSSIALHVLRVLEDALIKNASYDVIVKTRTPVALYMLNQKRENLRALERRFGACVTIGADDSLTGSTYYALERGELAAGAGEVVAFTQAEAPRGAANAPADIFFAKAEGETEEERTGEQTSFGAEQEEETIEGQAGEGEGDGAADGRRRRRRRRRRGRGVDREGSGIAANAPQPPDDALEALARLGGLQPAPSGDVQWGGDSTQEFVSSSTSADESGPPAGEAEQRFNEPSAEAIAEPAPEIAEEAALSGSAAEAEVDEGARQKPARRGRRTTRAPRRSAANIGEAEALPLEPTAVEAAPTGGAEESHPVPRQTRAQEPEPIRAAEPASLETPAEAETPHPAEAAQPEPAQPSEQDLSRPKRSGWWQRARASLRG